EAVRIPGRFAYSPSGESQFKVSRLAVGPVLAITPWNFPLAMSARKIAPALAAGCPVIAKPAPDTPLILLLLGEVLAKVFPEHGVTDGLVSILPTSDAQALARTLMSDPRLRKITFTGSTPVGRQLVRQAAENLQRTSMELGGNAPFVVAEDADIDLAVASALQAKLRNCGQVCVAANRFLVDSSIAEEFVDKLLVGLRAVRLGNGLDPETTVGPLVSVAQRNRVADLVSEAIADGSILRCGGHCPEGPGAFYPPTVLVDVPATSRIIREEIFGPVFTVTTFDGIEEGVAVANSTEFGLASYGFSNSVSTARYLAEHLEAGMVGINRGTVSETAAPFGGIKQSGFGREGGIEGIEEYLDIRYVLS
ncbi:aldehyde dehydrogenase family protein, partial [Corynebacterium flavescens]|uniref:aldehyde dehydrogenase family protein n=1 Tax=Corynebacterium flavescens TaxID=28028 RepID=UPI003FCF345F